MDPTTPTGITTQIHSPSDSVSGDQGIKQGAEMSIAPNTDKPMSETG